MSNRITYNSVKFVNFPNVSGIVPVKLFALRTLQDKEIFGHAIPRGKAAKYCGSL